MTSIAGSNRLDVNTPKPLHAGPRSGELFSNLKSARFLNATARSVGFLKRKTTKLTPMVLIQALIACVLSGRCSFRRLAFEVGLFLDSGEGGQPGTYSKQAFAKRIGAPAVAFVKKVVADSIRRSALGSRQTAIEGLKGVKGVLVGDSSVFTFHPSLRSHHPGSSNQHGVATAQVRFQLVFDLLGGRWLQGEPRPYRENDRSAARQILQGVLKAGDLLIRDLGYASIGVFEEIAAMKAWFLSRMIPGAVLFEAASGTRLDPLALAREKAPRPGDVCSVPVLLGVGKRLPCRLVIRNDGERVGSERRRRLAKEAKRRGTAPAKPYLKLQNWTLLVSNLDEGAASSEQLLALYETRWRIENVFKLAKSETKLSKLVGHRSNPHHIDLLLWGWILAMVEFGKMGFFATIESRLRSDGRSECVPVERSIFKAMERLLEIAATAIELAAAGSLAELMRRTMAQIEYHDRYEKRERKSLPALIGRVLNLHHAYALG